MILILRDGSDGGNKNCTLKCEVCGRIYEKTYVNAIRAKHHFCDIICRTEWQLDITHHPAWKGGEVKMLGYVFVKVKDHPYANDCGYVKRSRYIMEQAIGRYLAPEEAIHHINQIRDDDRLENMMLCSNNSEHMKIGHLRKVKQSNQLVLNSI